MSLRAMGPYNGIMPVPTGIVVGYMRDPKAFPYLRYTQLIPAPEIVFSYFELDRDDFVRLPSLNEFAWGYDDYRPTGKGFQLRGKFVDTRTERYDFPYQLGEANRRTWNKGAGIDPKALHDQTRANHAQLHRAQRVIQGLENASWGSYNTATMHALLGAMSPGADEAKIDLSISNEATLPSGAPDPRGGMVKKAFQRVKRRINLATNGAVRGDELYAVIPPKVADALAASAEISNYLKGSPFAKELTDTNVSEWNLPPSYAGFKLVVEDTVRCFIHQKADGTVADVTQSTEKDYILADDDIYFVSRPGGLDGVAGGRNFSTVQVYHFGGEARIEAFSEPKHDLTEGHVVMEDKVVLPATASGFKLTDVLSSSFS